MEAWQAVMGPREDVVWVETLLETVVWTRAGGSFSSSVFPEERHFSVSSSEKWGS